MKDKFIEGLFSIIAGAIFIVPMIIVYKLESSFQLKEIFIVFNYCAAIFLPFYFAFFYLKEKIVLKLIEKKYIFDKIDIKYYRDIINKYSPAVLSVVYDGKMEFNKDLMLDFYYLKNRGYLSVENDLVINNKNYVLTDDDLSILFENSDIFLSEMSYKDSNGTLIKQERVYDFHKKWSEKVFEKAKDYGLVIERKEKGLFRSLIGWIFVIEGLFMMFLNEPGLSFFAFFFALIYFLAKDLSFSWNQYPKTQAGYEVYAKLKGLKNFIKDFSILSERQIEEIKLWEDYMIYCILLNSNTNLNKDARRYFNKLRKAYNEQKKVALK